MLVVAIIRHLGEYFDFSAPEPVRCQTKLSYPSDNLSDGYDNFVGRVRQFCLTAVPFSISKLTKG
jgi:hypothetical protein